MKLTKYELELLQEAYLILDKDMTYDQEKEITEKTNSSISDLYELRFKLENMQASKKKILDKGRGGKRYKENA